MAQHPHTLAPDTRSAPWFVAAAAVTSLITYAVSSNDRALPAVMVCAILGAYFLPWRLRRGTLATWALRIALNVLLAMVAVSERQLRASIFDYYLHFATQICMLEMTLQCCQWPLLGGPGGAGILFFSGVVFVTASKFYGESAIRFSAPVYFLFVVLSCWAMRHAGRTPTTLPRQRRLSYGLALLLAMLLGFGIGTLITTYRNWLTVTVMTANLFGGDDAIIGLTLSPRLGSRDNVEPSTRRLLRIEGRDCPAHLRVGVFEQYRKGVWGPDLTARRFEPIPAPELQPAAHGERVQITRLAAEFSELALPLNAAGLSGRHRNLEWDSESSAPMRTWVMIEPPWTYEVVLSRDPTHQGPLCKPPQNDYRRRCLEVPTSIDPRVRQLALTIAGAAKNDPDRIKAVRAYLLEHHAYSLAIDVGSGDPVSTFLLEKKSAHCEYFASAAVILLRCLNVPARYVSGLFAHERRGQELLVVRERDAHAWAECWVEGSGWQLVDATPPCGVPDQAMTALAWWEDWIERIQESLSGVRAWLESRSRFELALAAMLISASLLGLRYWQQARRRTQFEPTAFTYAVPNAALTQLAHSFESLLSRGGVPCPEHLTWREHLQRLGAQTAAVARWLDLDQARLFAERYSQVRFGTPDDAVALAQLERNLKELSAKR